ncbi:zinc finger CCCH domain-containing protein 14-like [Salvia miltiorrhiza]|uniref:zinc finger CCCH domain-containing protein 14-like n=1 Tax=Salvia miltiorrhiza TaxID=226208 RepID=UPI0025ABC561|nr:zinc finger CCCH domain-containing protein 14-like [Salvia miltiorrhiza]XP_057809428.1 zinc finger CCCH domain-containing protein 14-like [Salvia miltiorrhiza]
MQREDISYDSLIATSAGDKSAAASLLFSYSNPFLSPTSPTYVNSDASFYSSLFQNYSSNSASDTASFDGSDTDRRLQDASCVMEYQQLYNRYTLCLAQLHDSIEEADALRRDNESLRLSNADLSHRIALLFSRDRLLSDFNRLNVASPSVAVPRAAHLTATQPLAEHNRVERRNTERVTLPKSISVRTSGYLKMTRPGRDTAGDKAVSQPTAALREQQRVYVGGSTKENGEELDVYNQGMTKTELCNKWQETGACPYGENCQFAHGINELRPVIRHPRYKTEVCRMVLAGDVCPYGHRCHFRHSLTEQERLMAVQPPPR